MYSELSSSFFQRPVLFHWINMKGPAAAILLLTFLKLYSCQFHTRYKKWLKSEPHHLTMSCNDNTCIADPDCSYDIQPLSHHQNFGAQITGLNLKHLSQACADKLIQDALMFRFLLFPNQLELSWQDEINFTEKMGEGQAFPETTSANRKVPIPIFSIDSKIHESISVPSQSTGPKTRLLFQ